MPTDRDEIRDLVENWALWRDAGDWARFRTVWHDDGVMNATWFQGGFEEFIRVSREGFDRGVRILHFLGGTALEVVGDRAIAQTKMTISQRGPVEGVECDVVCTGRTVVSGGVSLCAPKELAVLAFSVVDESPGEAGLRLPG